MELTKRNHFEFGRLPDDAQTFVSLVGKSEAEFKSGLEQAALDARYISETHGQLPIELCLSGGIDSEAMLQAFLHAKVPVRANFFRFENDLNLHDISTNLAIVEKLQIPRRIFDFQIINFFESGKFLEVAQKYECQSPQIAAHLWMLDHVDGLPCFAGNPIAPVWRNSSWFFVGLPGELHSTYFKYFLINERPGIPWFFIYSPELIQSFIHLDCMRPYREKTIMRPEQYTYLEKCRSYAEAGFNVKPRLDKFTGFEKVRDYYDQKMNTKFGTGFDQQFRRPLEKMFSFPEKYYQMIPQELMDGCRSHS